MDEYIVSKYDRIRGGLQGVALFTKPSTIKNVQNITGESETFITETCRHDELGDFVFIEMLENFVGLEEPKRVLLGLLENPKPINLLFVGDPGCGKTAMLMKFAEQLPAAHHHVRAQSADVATLDKIWEDCQYYPRRGKFHLVHIDEIDGATEKAQLQLLSRMDGTSCLKPMYGGGFERGSAPPIIYGFTSNNRVVDGKMQGVEPKFLSRCIVVNFEPVPAKELALYLKAIWDNEKGPRHYTPEYFEYLATGMGVRDALMRLDSELLGPRSLAKIRQILADVKRLKIEEENKLKQSGFLEDDAAAVRYGRQLRAQQLAASEA